MTPVDERPPPYPSQIFATLTAYRQTAALKTAIELEVFTAIGEGSDTAAALAARCGASERGLRILCDALVALEFLGKAGACYTLRPVAARYLDRRSTAYVGTVVGLLNAPVIAAGFADLTAAVRCGGTVLEGGGTVAPEHPLWVDFACAMAPLAGLAADALAAVLPLDATRPCRILDVAAGHGRFGIALAVRHAGAELVALDWPAVVAVAAENARAAGLGERFQTLAGDAFSVALGAGYDLALLGNFLHHFERRRCVGLLRRVRAALAPGGRAVAVDFVPDETRVSPPIAATFALTMLALTPGGDVYTFGEHADMFAEAGFARSELLALDPAPHRAVVAHV
jgi:SAM-dependent methyltransferase